MKIGPDYEITTDPYNWIVTEWVAGTDKDGNPKRQAKRSYHASLRQACERVLERIAGSAAAGTADEIIAAVSRAQAAICEAVRSRP